jgi:hypothetical protein
MRQSFIALTFLCGVGSGAEAQKRAADFADASARARLESMILQHIMKGITLSSVQTQAARRVTHDAITAFAAISMDEPDQARKTLAIIKRRDAALEGLLVTSADSATLRKNAAAMIHTASPPESTW